MIYETYGAHRDCVDVARVLAGGAGKALRLPWPMLRTGWSTRLLAGVLETFANLTVTHARLPFGINSVYAGGRPVAVTEEIVSSTPFAALLRFRKEVEPRVLLVAPMSGHFATLLRPTVKTMLADHDVFITDGAMFATCRRPRGASILVPSWPM